MPWRVVAVLLFALLLVGAPRPADWKHLREEMVERQIRARGIDDERVLAAMREIPRHAFVPAALRDRAYDDSALPIGHGQTISQPYVVAFMTRALALEPHHRVFELGTGSGYQAAVASRLAAEIYTVEIVPALAEHARRTLAALGIANVHVRAGDGWRGWPEAAPFDRIFVTAAAEALPELLLQQLAPGGRLIMPLGPAGGTQELVLVRKLEDGSIDQRPLLSVRFVPVTGDHR